MWAELRHVLVAIVLELVPEIIAAVKGGKSEHEIIARAKRLAIEKTYEKQAAARRSS